METLFDPNDYEHLQTETERENLASTDDWTVISRGIRLMYPAWVFPEMIPFERQPRLDNWHKEDLVAYCGGEYVKEDMHGS